MASKKITIVFLPGGTRKVKQFKIPRSLFLLFLLVLIGGALLLTWGIKDYRAIKTQIPRLAGLETENKHQKRQLAALALKMDHISTKMIELRKFENKLRTMVDLDINDDNPQFFGIGGSDPAVLSPDYTIEKAHKKLVRLMHRGLDNLDTEISVQQNETVDLYDFLKNQRSLLASTPSIWPTRGWMSSRFGYRISPFTERREFHKGIDISNDIKTPVIAPADGIVSSVGRQGGYGKILTINHGNNLKTRYAHLHKILVKKGQSVRRSDKIALMGKSGRTTGVHLHYEVYVNGVPVNPLRYILN